MPAGVRVVSSHVGSERKFARVLLPNISGQGKLSQLGPAGRATQNLGKVVKALCASLGRVWVAKQPKEL